MIKDELTYQILNTFQFTPTEEQRTAIHEFCDFLTSKDSRSIMLLCGSAGTGKTSLASAIVKTLLRLRQKVMLLAPTGRAAKVFSLYAGYPAFTIHRKIYRQKKFTGYINGFSLNDNLFKDMLFIIDEASMISNEGLADSAFFGSGRLLDDIMQYVYSGTNCRLMLIGDKAQLPPVGAEESPALMPEILQGYGLRTYGINLNEVVRQSSCSGILYNATVIRQMITHDETTLLPRIRLSVFADIAIVPGNELIEQLSGSYSKVGIDETIVITRSNKRANIYNKGIRAMVLGREEEMCTGDMLMIVKNSYYWTEKEEKCPLAFIANGDRACVLRVRNMRELYGFRFADAILQFPDYENYELNVTILIDTIDSEAPALTRQQSESLFNNIMEDYMDIIRKPERMEKIRNDQHYNAVQIKYAYAVTCHKAQGGQWSHVYLDQGYMADDMLTPDYIHWLYTAFTRATEKLYLVNWPKTQVAREEPPV